MKDKFGFLKTIGTIWKVLAWVVLVVGVLAAIGMLLMSLFGGEMMRRFVPAEQMPWSPRLFGAAGGIVTFIATLVVTIIDFLILYAVGEFIHLMLAIEHNTRLTAHLIQMHHASQAPPAPAVFSAPPPPPPPPPPAPRL